MGGRYCSELYFLFTVHYGNENTYQPTTALLVKLIVAQQPKPLYHYQNIKEKLHKTNASIWFNKICKTEHLTPNYIHITVNGNNQNSTKKKHGDKIPPIPRDQIYIKKEGYAQSTAI
jgi:hypothetical protein